MKKRSSVSAIVVLTFSSAILLLMVSATVAQDQEYGDRKSKEAEGKRSGIHASASSRGGVTASHIGFSPFPTPTPDDNRFIVDTGYPTGLDTNCQYRSQGSLKFKIAVKRYVGPVTANGSLVDAQKLKDNGVISDFAILRMPAKDIDFDSEPSPPYNPERDRLLFNGVPIGNLEGDAYLRGLNERWIMNEFKVPIHLVRFGQKGTNGNEPTPGENEIEILIDQANVESGEDIWCTSIDWASLSFKAIAPVIMIPGNGQCGKFFEGYYKCNEQLIGTSFVQPFEDAAIPYDNSIDLTPPKHIDENATTLLNEIPKKARQFGAKWIHLVAHSKGGLDAREFLVRTFNNCTGANCIGVLSLTTLSAPHYGSVGADIVYRSRQANIVRLPIPLSNELRNTLVARFFQSPNRGRDHLTTWHVEDIFNPANLPKLPSSFTISGETQPIKYFSFSADANIDNSREDNDPKKPTIQQNEVAGPFKGPAIMTQAYRFMGNTKTVRLVKHLKSLVAVVEIDPQEFFQDNDFLVQWKSAEGPAIFLAQQPTKDGNHATIIRAEIAQLVIPLIKSSQPR